MPQQINLYNALPKRKQAVLDAGQMLFVLLVFTTILGALSAYSRLQLNASSRVIAMLNEDQKKAQQELLLLAARKSKIASGEDLKATVSHLQQAVAQKQQLYEELTQVHYQQGAGFSAVFTALAEQTMPAIWLREIHILNAGKDLELTGSGYNPKDITHYLHLLSKASVLKNKRFLIVELSQSKDYPKVVDFLASTRETRP